MSVPSFQEFTLPLLSLCSTREEVRLADAVAAISDELGLTAEERAERVPSGVQTKAHNRASWAGTYLKKAGLLESPRRGHLRITQAGRAVLQSPPARLDVAFLNQFPGMQEFRTLRRPETDEPEPARAEREAERDETPEEALESGYRSLRAALADELLEIVRRCSPRFFEELVIDLLVAMGYGGSRADAGQAIGRSGDGGIDGIIKEDRLGLDAVYVQAKRWEAAVGRPVVQAFAGSLEGARARKGVLITTSRFSDDAKQYVKNIEKRIVLIDGEQLAEFMIDFNIGVNVAASYVVKRVDSDYFAEGEVG